MMKKYESLKEWVKQIKADVKITVYPRAETEKASAADQKLEKKQ